MKTLVLSTFVSFIVLSCNTAGHVEGTMTGSDHSDNSDNMINENTREGSSFDNAIFIDEKTENDGVDAEYTWLRKNYPDYHFLSQTEIYKDKKHYDVFKIITSDGRHMAIYFDITQFFGHM